MTHIVVVGAGIAGLSAALALARSRTTVTIVERRRVLDEAGAGLQLSPNAVRCLDALGVGEAVRARATESEAVHLWRSRDAAPVATVPLGRDARRRYGAPFLLVHRADLQETLVAAACSDGRIHLRLGCTLSEGIGTEPAAATITDEEGATTTIGVDGIVGAEGVHAGVAARGDRDSVVPSGRTAWRSLVPADSVAARFRAPVSNLWLGPRAHLVHYPIRGSTLINVVAVLEAARAPRPDTPDLWTTPGDPAALAHALAGWDPIPLALIKGAPFWRVWTLFEGRDEKGWSDGARTRVGDAAHPMLPFLAQGASQAIEDAAALGAAVSTFPDDLPRAFRIFEQVRRPRAKKVQDASRTQGHIYHLGGAAALVRDAALRILGPERLASRMDWLYGHDATLLPAEAPKAS